jgi:hypothetical protein
MTQVENSIYQSVELKPENPVELDKLLHLLIDLKIIESPELPFPLLPSETDNSDESIPEEIELLQLSPATLEVCEAYLESDFNDLHNISNYAHITQEEFIEISATFEDNSEDALQKLREILVGYELAEINNITAKFKQKLTKIEHQIYDSKELINLLLPWMSELLRLTIAESRDEIIQIIAPIIDQTIRSSTQQDKTSMSTAIAPAIPLAISQQIIVAPKEVSDAIAPVMGRAIKKQIEIEESIVVDALYPIIGSTIAKYMALQVSNVKFVPNYREFPKQN